MRITSWYSENGLEFDTWRAEESPPFDTDDRLMVPFVSQDVPHDAQLMREAHLWAMEMWEATQV